MTSLQILLRNLWRAIELPTHEKSVPLHCDGIATLEFVTILEQKGPTGKTQS